MSYELTNEEKINVIESRIKNIYRNEYSLQISKIEEQSKTSPDQSIINNLNSQIADIAKQTSALEAEITKLTASN
jgi:hypothetical protein